MVKVVQDPKLYLVGQALNGIMSNTRIDLSVEDTASLALELADSVLFKLSEAEKQSAKTEGE